MAKKKTSKKKALAPKPKPPKRKRAVRKGSNRKLLADFAESKPIPKKHQQFADLIEIMLACAANETAQQLALVRQAVFAETIRKIHSGELDVTKLELPKTTEASHEQEEETIGSAGAPDQPSPAVGG